jgi:hypothetical protein
MMAPKNLAEKQDLNERKLAAFPRPFSTRSPSDADK